MRRLPAIAGCAFALSLAVAAGATASGGPVPAVQGGAGVTLPGSDVRYQAIAARGGTLVQRVRVAGGTIERFREIRGRFGVPGAAFDGSTTGLSADGRTLVLAEVTDNYPATRTRLVVLIARTLHVRAHITLPGFFTVDAISPSGRWLYLIHYKGADALHYEVRAYDVDRGRLVRKPVVDPREPDEAMQGLPMTRILSADGRWAYTLYQRPERRPFIHALDTQRRTAACIDLPALDGDLSALRLTLERGGATLTVGQPSGPVAIVDTRTFAVRRPQLPPLQAPARRSAPPADDGGGGLPWALGAIGLAALAALAALAGIRRRRHAAGTPAG